MSTAADTNKVPAAISIGSPDKPLLGDASL